TARYGADERPDGVLALRAVRSPHARARFEIGDLAPLRKRYPGLVDVFAAADVPGQNRYGVYPTGKDQPALADGVVRYRGEAILALVGDERTLTAIDDRELPIIWEPLPPLHNLDDALAAGAPDLHEASPGNVLIRGRLASGDDDAALTGSRFHGDFDTGAYASWGPTVANRVPVHAMGPYAWGAVLTTTRAVYTNNPPAGAFRGFGVPQAAVAHEALMDELAARLSIDPLELRLANALTSGSTTASGQLLRARAGLAACLEA